MASCICTTTALRTLIKDLTGLTVKQQRQQAVPLYRTARTFSARASSRQLETSRAVPAVGNDFLPFVSAGERKLPDQTIQESKNAVDEAASKEVVVDEDWHAEVDVVAQQAQSYDEDALVPLADRISTGGLEELLESSDTIAPTVVSSSIDKRPKYSLGRKAARLLRKQRRIETNEWKPSAHWQATEVEGSGAGKQSVLGKIEAMDGPSIAPKKFKVVAEKKPKNVEVGISAKERQPKAKARIPPALLQDKNEAWKIQKAALVNKFGEKGWQPRKRLSPDTLEGIRALHKSDPAAYSTEMLADHFKITPEAIRRILKSKWRPNEDEVEQRRLRWEKRGVKKWEEMAKDGAKPPAKWRAQGVKSPKVQWREEMDEKRGRQQDLHVKWA
jgi:hypothetical protein